MIKKEAMLPTSAANCPVSAARTPAVDAQLYIDRPGVARANIAVSSDAPCGSPGCSEANKDLVGLPFGLILTVAIHCQPD